MTSAKRRTLALCGLTVAIVALTIGLRLWATREPARFERNVFGVIESSFQPASKKGNLPMQLSVRLDDDSLVSVALPIGQPYILGGRVKLGVYTRGAGPDTLREARFEAYVEPDANAPP